jgi:hypothetical protein
MAQKLAQNLAGPRANVEHTLLVLRGEQPKSAPNGGALEPQLTIVPRADPIPDGLRRGQSSRSIAFR